MFKTKINFKEVVKTPAFIMLLISLVVLTIQILVIGKLRPFNSDDLYWQQAVRTWTPFSGDTFYFGTEDIFVALGSFFTIFEFIFSPSRKLLLLETLILTGSTFILFYLSSLYFLQKLRVKIGYLTLLPFVWLASFGYPLVQNYLNSDWRTFQIGFSFATFALVAAYLNRDIDPLRTTRTKTLTALGLLFTGLLMYGDPFYTFFTIVPLGIFAIALFYLQKIDKTKLYVLLGGIAACTVIAKIFSLIGEKAGIQTRADAPSVFIDFDNIIDSIVTSLHSLLIIFDADFFGRNVGNIVTFGFAINACLLLAILAYGYLTYQKSSLATIKRLPIAPLWTLFFIGTMVFTYVIYTVSTLGTLVNYRFFIMFVYMGVALLVIMLATNRNKNLGKAIVGLLLAATTFNIAHNIMGDTITKQWEIAGNIGNSQNYQIIDFVRAQGLTKGYASYWQGNVNTYLSKGKVTFLPARCTPDGKTEQFRWLIDGGQFDKLAKKSFHFIDPSNPDQPVCSLEQLEDQFGKPARVMNYLDKTLLIYNYDITDKILK